MRAVSMSLGGRDLHKGLSSHDNIDGAVYFGVCNPRLLLAVQLLMCRDRATYPGVAAHQALITALIISIEAHVSLDKHPDKTDAT